MYKLAGRVFAAVLSRPYGPAVLSFHHVVLVFLHSVASEARTLDRLRFVFPMEAICSVLNGIRPPRRPGRDIQVELDAPLLPVPPGARAPQGARTQGAGAAAEAATARGGRTTAVARSVKYEPAGEDILPDVYGMAGLDWAAGYADASLKKKEKPSSRAQAGPDPGRPNEDQSGFNAERQACVLTLATAIAEHGHMWLKRDEEGSYIWAEQAGIVDIAEWNHLDLARPRQVEASHASGSRDDVSSNGGSAGMDTPEASRSEMEEQEAWEGGMKDWWCKRLVKTGSTKD